ncbi:MerR family transcriptional regulator [Falsihalocynthiibacter sp. BN13B15]|uniref:helix-turn-helix domain-containing protein n=1 Tax=Falsihalocynthiibacter sp. BN13B15 TaxID=3240871 RepID=UPI00350FA033
MRISDVAERVGIPVSTIRFYEKRDVIREPSRHGRNRCYSEEDVRAIQFVRDAQSLGLQLREISALVQNTWSKGEMAKAAAAHRKTVKAQIEALQRVDKALSALEECPCTSLVDCNLSSSDCSRYD